MTDLDHVGRLDDVTLMTFSEFGRRLAQNGRSTVSTGWASTLTARGDLVSEKLGDTYTLTLLQPGTYDYFCEPHPRMVGSIVVQ